MKEIKKLINWGAVLICYLGFLGIIFYQGMDTAQFVSWWAIHMIVATNLAALHWFLRKKGKKRKNKK